MKKISILMPAYNVEKYIAECMESVIHQTLEDIEIIVIDDGSTDQTAEILDEYADKDSRIQVIHKSNSGYGDSMNVALSYATGEYVGVIETDDYAELNMFEKLYETAKQNDADVVKCNYYNYFYTKEPHDRPVENIERVGIVNTPFSPKDRPSVFSVAPSIWSGIYRHKMILDNGICFNDTPGASYQDTSFAFMIWASSEKIVLISDTLLHYRRDNDSSSVNSGKKVFCVCDEFDKIQSFLDQNPVLKESFEEVKTIHQIHTYLWNYSRLAIEYKYAFLLKMREDFQQYEVDKNIYASFFPESEWESYKLIINDMDSFYQSTIEKELKGKNSVQELSENLSSLKRENAKLKKDIVKAKDEQKRIRNSNSFRIGRAITAIPRRLKG